MSWSVKWPEYKPIEYTANKLLKDKPVWADGENPLDIKNWNKLDRDIDRRSHMGIYEVIDGIPRNPVGRTGVSGTFSIKFQHKQQQNLFIFTYNSFRSRTIGKMGSQSCS